MATLCTHCGTPLSDGARYCNNCGTLIPSHPLSPQSLSSTSSGGLPDKSKGREQIAQHSPPYPSRSSAPNEPPSWMSQLANGAREQSKGSPEPQLDFPVPEPIHRSSSPARELHIKVWEQKEPETPGGKYLPVEHREKDAVEDLPTNPHVASVPDRLTQRNAIPLPASEIQNARFNEVERVDTVPLATPPGIASLSPIKDLKQTSPPQALASPPRRRKPFAVVLILLLVIVGGAVAWIVLFQPFSVPGITQPQQSFKNSQLGFSLLYPSGWISQVDQSKVAAYFYDSSHTAQVNVVVGSSNGGDLSHYLRQEASRLGITGQKNAAALSFAGASWQQLQGSVLLRGASYSETLLATVHNQRLFTIMLLAPQATYAQEEQLVFSAMRSSFQFIP